MPDRSRETLYASVGRRLTSYLLDGAASLLVLAIGVVPARVTGNAVLVAVGYAAALVLGVLQWYLLGRRGWTVGKRVVGTRVVDMGTGAPIGMGRALLRSLVLGLLGATVVLLVVLAFAVRAHPRRQGWHDRAARSVEVRAGREAEVAGGPAGFVPRTPPPPPPPPSLATTVPPPPPLTSSAAPVAGQPAAPYAPPPPNPVAGSTTAPVTPVAPVAPVIVAPLPDGGVVPPPPGLVSPVVEPDPAATPSAGWVLRPADGSPVPVTGALLVGRDPDLGLHGGATAWRVDDPLLTVSKTHALLTADERVLRVEDLDSTHGVVIRRNGDEARIDARRPTRLLAGDVLVLGAFEIAVEGAQ